MRKYVTIAIIMAATVSLWGQTKPIKVVFDVSGRDSLSYASALRHVTMMSDAYPDSQFEVVVFGNAMTMLIKDKSNLGPKVENLAARKNVVFKACEVSMKRHKVDQNGLILGVQTVPDGIVELVTKQNEGWGYIKE